MSGGIRHSCAKCFASGKNYDTRLQRCNRCGWIQADSITQQPRLTDYEVKKK